MCSGQIATPEKFGKKALSILKPRSFLQSPSNIFSPAKTLHHFVHSRKSKSKYGDPRSCALIIAYGVRSDAMGNKYNIDCQVQCQLLRLRVRRAIQGLSMSQYECLRVSYFVRSSRSRLKQVRYPCACLRTGDFYVSERTSTQRKKHFRHFETKYPSTSQASLTAYQNAGIKFQVTTSTAQCPHHLVKSFDIAVMQYVFG